LKKQIANLTSNILNPVLLCLAIVFFLSLEATSTTSEALKWSLIAIVINVLPPLLIIIYLVSQERLEDIFISIRSQRNKIYLMAGFFTALDCLVLFLLDAPLSLMVLLLSGLAVIIIFMLINFFWKISLHTAFAAATLTVFTILYGAVGAISAVLLPPVAWSRIELERHSPAQAIAGAVLAVLIVSTTFYLFGLISS